MPDLLNVPPGVPPEDYQSFIQAQRQSALAQALMQGAFTPPSVQNPEPVKGIYVQPRVGAIQGLSKIADALLGRRASDQAIKSQVGMAQALNQAYAPGGQMTSPGMPLQAAPPATDPAEQSVQPAIARAPGQSLAQTVQATQPQFTPVNPRNPQGLPADVVRNLAMTDPAKYAAMLQGPEAVQLARLSGQDPRAAAADALSKATTNIQDVRPGNTAFDLRTRTPIFTAPDQGIQTSWQNGQPVQSTVPGALEAQREAAAAKTAGTQSQTPIKLGTDENGRDIYGYPSPPGPNRSPAAVGAPNATAPGQTASPANVKGQQSGAEAGQAYASELSKNATGATEVRRSLSELKNLANQSGASGLNEGKMKLGTYMIAAGMDPQTVGSFLGVDVGALQAAQKQTSTLAVNTIHSMTSRGTNFDLDTFMRNNPNLNMADPAAFGRVVDYMDSKAKQEIAKQKDFAQWKQGVSPDQWETGHTAHWLDLQNQMIDQGKSNSRPPLSSFVRP